MRFVVSIGRDWRQTVNRAKMQARQDIRKAARIAVDRAANMSLDGIRAGMRGAGLGKLGFAVGESSAQKKRDDGLWAVLYAKGTRNPDSRGAGALEAYTEGVVIRPKPGNTWLAYATGAIPKFAGRKRMTPALYKSTGLESRLGPLIFRPTRRAGVALLVVKNVSVSPKNGRARKMGPRGTRTRIAMKEIVVFVLIRYTRRAQRFDHRRVVAEYAAHVPDFMAYELDRMSRGRG